MRKLALLTLLLSLVPEFALAQFAGNANHPELRWEVIETDHFKLYFHQGLASFADRAARAAESAYAPVTSLYGFEPAEKVRIVLNDADDFANGAAYYYHNTIQIWVTNLDFSLRGTTDWLRNVITHEFTHIVSLQTGRKGSRRIPAIFLHYIGYQSEGRREDILDGYPNILASYAIPMTMIPPWFAEGTAQYMARGAQYDRWDSHRDMVLRQATFSGTLLTYDEMGVFGAKTGLGFEKVYDHGYSLVLYIVNQFGEDKLVELYRSMATWWRYDFGSAVEDVLEISGRELHSQWTNNLQERYDVQKAQLKSTPAEGTSVYAEGYLNLYPRWSPDGDKIAFLTNSGGDYGRTSLRSITLADSTLELIAPSATGSLDWTTDGSRLLYAKQSMPNKFGSRYWDLYAVDPDKSRKVSRFQAIRNVVALSSSPQANELRLTTEMRALHPSYSPNGKEIVFVKNGGGNSNLGILEIDSGETRDLTQFDDGSQIYTPGWSPDGNTIVFSMYQPGESRNICMIPSEGGEIKQLVASTGTDRDPCWVQDGEGLVFSSDVDGIFNLYHLGLASSGIHRITRVKGGAFQPHVSPSGDRIAFSHYGSKGYEIRVIDSQGLWEAESSNGFLPRSAINPVEKMALELTSRPYTNDFTPLTILPRIAVDSDKLKLGFVASSDDVLEKQSLFVSGMAASDLDLDLYAIYEYRRKRPTFFAEAYRLTRHVEEDIVNRNEDFKIFSRTFILGGFELGTRFKFRSGSSLDVRGIYQRNSTTQDQARFNGLNRGTLGATVLNGFDLAFTYRVNSIARSRDSEINPSLGREIAFRYDRQFNFFLNGFDQNSSILTEIFQNYFYNQVTLDWTEHLPIGPNRNALALRVYGGSIDRPVDDYFDYFLGGLPFMKGYTFYSLEGRRAAMIRAAYRFPLWSRMDRQSGPIYSDQLYGAVYAGIGRAWDGDELDNVLNRGWKRDIGAQLRYEATSFYLFPTRVSLDFAYGLDTNPLQERSDPLEKSGLKVYFTLLFGFLQSAGHR